MGNLLLASDIQRNMPQGNLNETSAVLFGADLETDDQTA
jgi:hypothetical protein